MSKQVIADLYNSFDKVNRIIDAVKNDEQQIEITNLNGSSLSMVISSVYKASDKPLLFICNDKEEAAYYLNDLEQFLENNKGGSREDVLFYPGSYRRPYQIEDTDNANILLRAEVLNRINSQKKPALIVTYADALFEQVITKSELKRNTLKLAVSDTLSLDFVHDLLHEFKFNRVDFVVDPGDFAIRGGIIDVFSFSNDHPYRIEFYGDEIDSIRSFDIESQLSIDRLSKIDIMPNVENKFLEEKRQSFLKYISSKTTIFIKNPDLNKARLDKLFEKAKEAFENLKGEI